MDTNHIIIKTFEQFQNENKQYYPNVVQYLTAINDGLKGTRQVGNWVLDGNVSYEADTEGEDSKMTEHTLICHNETEGLDIDITWNFSVTVARVTPDTDVTPGSTDYETDVTIDQVVLYTDFGNNEYQIVVDNALSQLCISILDKLNTLK